MSSDDSDDEINVYSENFNALKALYAKNIPIPCPKAKIFDNVATFEGYMKRLASGVTLTKSKKKLPTEPVKIKRNFLPHQEPIKTERPKRLTRNIFTKIDNGFEGPLGVIKKYMDEKIKVKIYTRKKNGIRGTITGYIEIFDRHWNFSLLDVLETWKKRKKKYMENKVTHVGEPQDCSDLLARMRIAVPAVKAISMDRKYVECTRKMPKLFIRGEQIVLVTPIKV